MADCSCFTLTPHHVRRGHRTSRRLTPRLLGTAGTPKNMVRNQTKPNHKKNNRVKCDWGHTNGRGPLPWGPAAGRWHLRLAQLRAAAPPQGGGREGEAGGLRAAPPARPLPGETGDLGAGNVSSAEVMKGEGGKPLLACGARVQSRAGADASSCGGPGPGLLEGGLYSTTRSWQHGGLQRNWPPSHTQL